MDKEGLILNSRFALPPNSLGYCGNNSAPAKFKACITQGECKGVDGELKKFIVLHPYLKTIAKISSINIFSRKVAECYWFGNELASRAKASDYKILMDNFEKQGVPKYYVLELRKRKPANFIPTHLFQVLFIGAYGGSSLSQKEKIKWVNNCMIRWGKVVRKNKNTLRLNLCVLRTSRGVFKFTQNQETIQFNPGFLSNLKTGDTIAVHWNYAVMTIDENQTKNIILWSEKVLEFINRG